MAPDHARASNRPEPRLPLATPTTPPPRRPARAQTIAEHAFTASPYPLVLSIEMHCSLPQQQTLAAMLVEILGEALYVPDAKACRPAPCPPLRPPPTPLSPPMLTTPRSPRHTQRTRLP